MGKPENLTRALSEEEQIIIRLVKAKHGDHKKDKIFFIKNDVVMFQSWGTNGDGPWVHVTNLASWYAKGEMALDEIKETQF